MTKLIRLTEVLKDGDGTKTQPMLIQSDFIGTVTTGKLEKATVGGVHLIGKTQVQEMTFITLKNNVGVFVEESLEQIESLTADPITSIHGKN